MDDGTHLRFDNGTVTIGKAVDVYPISAYGYTAPAGAAGAATCPSIPTSTGPVMGVVKGPWRREDNKIGVMLIAFGTPIHGIWAWIDTDTVLD